jgi:uncharacterized repeat protein (TIGR02543 family)
MTGCKREASMKRSTVFALRAVLVFGLVIFFGACSSGGGSSTPAIGNTPIQNNAQGTQAASSGSQGIDMAVGMAQAFGNLGNAGLLAEAGIQAPPPGTFGNFEQSPAIGRLAHVTSKFAIAQFAGTAASGFMGAPIRHILAFGSGTCTDGGSYTLGPSTDGGLAALYFSACRENNVQVDGEYDILIFGPVTSGYTMSVTLGSASTPTAFTLQDFASGTTPSYSTLISETTMTGLPMSITMTGPGSSVTSVSIAVSTGSMSIDDIASSQTYTVSLMSLYDSYVLSTSGTGTTTTYTTKGTVTESWGSNSITETFTNFQLVLSPGIAPQDQDMSVSGTLSIAFTPAFCQNGTFTFVTDTPIVYDDLLGYTTAGQLTVNGATTITYNADGSITVTTGGQSQTYPNLYALTQVCPIATLGGPAAYTVTYNGNGGTGGSVPIDSSTYQQGDNVTVLGNTGSLVNTGYTFVGWNMSAGGGAATTYTPGNQFPMPAADVTLYAVWTTSPYTVTYNGTVATIGSAPVDPNNYEQGETVTVLSNTGGLAYPGYFFGGWNMASNGSSTTYQPGQTFPMPAADVVLYAVWSSSNVLGYAYVANNAANIGNISQYAIASDGTLSALSPPTVAAGSCPLSITADPSGKYVYSTDVCDNYKIYQYAIGAGGLLTPIASGSFAAGGGYPSSVIVDPTGKYVYVANEGGASISQYTISSGTGSLISMSTPTVAALAGDIALATDPTGSYLYAAIDASNGYVSLYDIGTGGALSLSSVGTSIPGAAYSEAIAVSGQYVYEASFTAYSGYISQYAIGGSGVLSFLTPSTYTTGAAAEGITAVSGKYVYVANSGDNDITQYAIVSGGTLSALSPFTAATGNDPTGVAADPTGSYVYVTNYGDGTVSQFMIGLGGTLTSLTTPTVPAGYGPRSIVTVGIP